MKLGYSPTTASILDLEQAFRVAERLDFEFIELSCELVEIAPRVQTSGRVLELSRASGVGVTVHLPFVDLNLASLIPETRRVALERVQRGLDYAANVGARCAVLHSGQNPFYQPIAVSYAEEALRESFVALKQAEVPIALENLAVSRFDIIRGPTTLQRFSKEAGFANCLDIGHAFVEQHQSWRSEEEGGKDLIQDYLDILGENIIHLHIHGNDGYADQHRPTSEGMIPFERYTELLSDFAGGICLEVAGGEGTLELSVKHLRGLTTGLVAGAHD